MSMLDVSNLTYQVEDGVTLLENISFQAKCGECIGVMGANGAGKTTLLKLISGLLDATSGTVKIDGTNISATPSPARARTISYMEQLGGVAWPLSVEYVIGLGRFPHGAALGKLSDLDRQAIDAAAQLTETEHLLTRDFSTLSGGERARVLLARALAVQAPMLVADEPIASLDPNHQLHMMEVLRNVAQSGNLVLCALHDLSLAAQYCSRILVLTHGKIVADDAPGPLFESDAITKAYGITTRILESGGRKFVVTLSRAHEPCE